MSNTPFEDNPSYSFEGKPEENLDVQQEVQDHTKGMSYDPYRLTEILMELGQRMIGVELYDYQYLPSFRIMYSILVKDGDELTLLFSRQSGKSEIITFVCITLGIFLPVLSKVFPKELGYFSRGIKIGLFAPQAEQVDTVYRRLMDRVLSPAVQMFISDPDINDTTLSSVNFKLKSGTSVLGQSAAKQSKIESKTYHLVFIDESQDVDTDKIQKSITPMTASTFGTIVMTGTPTRHKGHFYFAIQRGKKEDRNLSSMKMRKMKQKHFEYDYLKVIASKKAQYKKDGQDFHLLYEKSVLRDKKNWGEHSDNFRLAYKIEWILDVGMFITEDVLESAWMNKRITFPTYDREKSFVVSGLDIASARNKTVLTSAVVEDPAMEFGEKPTKIISDWLVLSGMNYEEQFHVLAERLLANGTKVLYADYTGVGRALTDILVYHLQDYMEIVPYTFSVSSKSDMWKALDEDGLNGKIVLPANKTAQSKPEWKEFVSQMTNLQKSWKGNLMVCDKTSGYEDDYCDSVALMNLAGNHLYQPPSIAEVSENVFYGGAIRRQRREGSRW